MRKSTQSVLRGGVSLVVAVSLVCGCGALLFTGCKGKDDKKKITEAVVNNLDIYYLPQSTIDFDSVTLTVTYDDGSSEVLKKAEFDIESGDAEEGTEFILYTDGLYAAAMDKKERDVDLETGDYEISYSIPSYKYNGDSETVTVGNDYKADLQALYYSDPDFLSEYKFRSGETASRSGDEDTFYKSPEKYYVGDDNGFVFKPEFIVTNPRTGATGTFSGYESELIVSLKSGDGTNLDIDDYVSCDGFTAYFTEAAEGQTFTVSVMSPEGMTMSFENMFGEVSMDVTVADGWNAYSALDLGMMNVVSSGFNISEYVTGDDEKSHNGGQPDEYFWDEDTPDTHVGKYTYQIWEKYLEEKGYDVSEPVNGMFLHGDITVTESDIPEEFLISEAEASHYGVAYDAMVGTVRDGIKLYEKNIEDDDFTFNGNLFTIDCNSLRWAMTRLNNQGEFSYYREGYSGTHTGSRIVVFGVQGLTDADTTKERHTATFENINAVGNAIDPNDEEGHAAGSPSFIESRSASTDVENCIVKNFLYAFRISDSDDSYVNLTADYDKVFDCYFSGIRVARSARNEVNHSELRRFSGPVVMEMCETEENARMGSYYEAGITIDDYTEMENFISGSEAWFVSAGASSIATYITLADGVVRQITNGKRTVLNEDEGNKINLLQFGHDTEDFGKGGVRLNTYFLMGNGVPFVLNESNDLEPDGTASEELKADNGLYNAAVTNYFINEELFPQNYLLPIAFSTEKGEICAIDSGMNWSFDPVALRNNGYTGAADSSKKYDKDTNSIGEVNLSPDAEKLYIYYDMGGVGLSLVVTLYEL